MVKKRRPKPRRHVKRIKDKDWGENFGKWMEKRGREVGGEMGNAGERFGKHMERHGKEWSGFWYDTLGFIGPLIGSIIGIVFLTFGIWILNLINLYLVNIFIFLLSTFLLMNIQWFFLASLFFGYGNYFSRRHPKTYWIFSPVVTGIRAVFILWFLASIFILISVYTNAGILEILSRFFYENLWPIFIVVVFFGYIFEFVKKIFCMGCKR